MRLYCIIFLFSCVLNGTVALAAGGTFDPPSRAAEPSDWFSDSEIAGADSRAKDEEALVALYNATNGDNWDNQRGWSGTSMSLEDDIFGVEVEEINGELRVVLIRLNNNGSGDPRNNLADNKGNNLSGYLPNELGNLKELRHFNVMSNNLSGSLPGGMRYCIKIEEAYFEGTKSTNSGIYTGEGEWGEPPTPQERAISLDGGKWNRFYLWPYNNFSGSLPGEWSDWENIQILSVAGTTLDSDGKATVEGITGELPPEWGQWDTIVQLYLHVNKMTGSLPKEWAGMTELVDLWLGGNQLGSRTQGDPAGQLPAEWGGGTSYGEGMRKLRHLSMGSGISGGSASDYFNGAWTNTFDGPIPENWGNMKMLHKIILPDFNNRQDFPAFFNSGNYHNRVTSSDPDPDANPVEAWTVGLTTISNINNMTAMPDPSKLTYLSRFVANGNPFNQQVPATLSEWTRMKQLLISGTGLTGSFPDLTNWRGTKIFEIAHNNFSGSLPELNTNDSEQRNIQAQHSGFSGPIPESWNFPGSNGFFRLWLHGNNLSGPIPERLADPGHSYSSGFRVDGNRYVFADLVPFIALGPNNFQYAPQQAFGSSRTRYVSEGGSVTIDDFETVVTHPDNRYRWEKDGAEISGATSRTLTLTSFSAADEGRYTLVVTNPGAPELTLTSKTITLKISK